MDFDKETRGEYFFQVIWIEEILDDIIAFHFCPTEKERGLMKGVLLNELGFRSKIKVFLSLLELYPKFNFDKKKIKGKLDNVRELRNKYAHAKLDTSIQFMRKKSDSIRLIFYKSGEEHHLELNPKSVKTKLVEITKLHVELQDIAKKISNNQIGVEIPVGKLDDT